MRPKPELVSDDGTQCSGCGGHKFPHEEFCRECIEQRDLVRARERQRRRDQRFGPLWPRDR